jgi:hypothetical protein
MGNSAEMMSPLLGKRVVAIGVTILALGMGRLLLRYGKKIWEDKRSYISYILIWVIVCFGSLIIFK